MKTPPRPTQRCLKDDLTDDWDDVSDRRLVLAGRAGIDKAVHLLGHKLIRKAVGDFPSEGDSVVERESISGLANPPFWKVKTERWRGAVYVDEASGQSWLVAAGLRYGGEGKDFYSRFMADVRTRGSEFFLPGDGDLQLLKDELAQFRVEERERHTQDFILQLLSGALASEDGTASGELYASAPGNRPIARVDILMYEPSQDDPAEPRSVLIEVQQLDWAFSKLLAWDEQVMLATLCPAEDRWGTTEGSTRLHSIDVASSEELSMMASGELASEVPGFMSAGTSSHTVHRERLTQCTVEGQPVKAVCGRWFVPRQDHEGIPSCPTCDTIAETLRLQVARSTPNQPAGRSSI